MKRYIWAAILLFVSGIGLETKAANIPESEEPIKLAINEWTGQHITTTIAGELLKRMGYKVEYVTAGYYPMLTALSDGDLDAALEIWHGNVGKSYFDLLSAGKIEEYGEVGLKGGATWMYPAYLDTECPGLPNWEALKSCAGLFATAETFPKGRFVDYPADWGDTGNPQRIKALGLDFDTISAGSEGSLIAEIRAAFARKSPLLIMFWRPHWIHAEVELKSVTMPEYTEACKDDPAWGINPNATYDCGFFPESITKAGWPGLKDKWPGAYRLIKTFQVTNQDQEGMMKEIDGKGRDLQSVVDEWLNANQDRWNAWIATAKAP